MRRKRGVRRWSDCSDTGSEARAAPRRNYAWAAARGKAIDCAHANLAQGRRGSRPRRRSRLQRSASGPVEAHQLPLHCPPARARDGLRAAACAAPPRRAPRPSSTEIPEALGDLLVHVAAGDVAQHFALARRSAGRARDPPRGRRRRPLAAKASSTKPASRGEKTASPSATRRSASRELGARDRLRHVAAGAGPDHGDDVLGGVGHRQGQETHLRAAPGSTRRITSTPPPSGMCTSSSTTSGVGCSITRTASATVPASADDRQAIAQLGSHAGPEQVMVVDDHDARLSAHAGCNSISSSTSVPSPRALCTAARPP